MIGVTRVIRVTRVIGVSWLIRVPDLILYYRWQVDVLLKLQHCPQVIRFIEVFHCEFHTILVTEFLPGERFSRIKLRKVMSDRLQSESLSTILSVLKELFKQTKYFFIIY